MRRVGWLICLSIAVLAMPEVARAAGPTFSYIGLAWHESADDSSPQQAAAISASAGVGTARFQLRRTAIVATRQFQQSSDYQAAQLAALQAFSAYEVAEANALYAVRQTTDGVASQVAVDRLEKQLDDARQQAKFDGKDHSEKITALALELLSRRSMGSHREAQALAADPRLTTLRYAWLDADAHLAELNDSLAQQLRSDPQWKAAKSQLEQARTALASISQ